MNQPRTVYTSWHLPAFGRDFLGSDEPMTCIGTGAIGGKASGLAAVKELIADRFARDGFDGIEVTIPRLTVIATDFFDRFMHQNRLYDTALSEASDQVIAHEFQAAELPADLVGDLRALTASVHTPLAVRSSSLLEDALEQPMAGVYGTKMIPNNQPDTDTRFRKLIEAVKFVYASTFFRVARDYVAFTGHSLSEEKMAVIIQEVVGRRHDRRFYPTISGVARSYDYYPMGRSKADEGVVDLALGLGKTIVDGGLVWTYSPAHPKLNPPVGSNAELLKNTQTKFWAVNMGSPPAHDPIRETEYLVECDLHDADLDGTLRFTASTYQARDDRLVPGTGPDGPRVVTFAPILKDRALRLNDLLLELLTAAEETTGNKVEMEFAVTLDVREARPARFGFLQVRPMAVPEEEVSLNGRDMAGDRLLLASDRVMGNGVLDTVRDIVYVRPQSFEAKYTRVIAGELGEINRGLLSEGTNYLLIGFGRWGSSDPWLGIPVEWSQICNASVIVEATLPTMNVELSQGSHFFHNLAAFHILYFMVRHDGRYEIDWDWLRRCEEIAGTDHVAHVRTKEPLSVRVDGRSGRGVIRR